MAVAGDSLIPTGLGSLQSLQILQGLMDPSYQVSKLDLAGMVAGGLIGWWVANKFPAKAVGYVGVIVGAELGILLFRTVRGKVP